MSSNDASSAVTYTSISSETRSWSISTKDPYEEAARQALEQASPPPSPAYVPDPVELEDHVPVLYPADGGDDDDDNESSDDDDDDDDDDVEDDEEEEEHLAPAESTAVSSPTIDHIPIPFPSEEEVARLLALPTPPPSPLTPLSSPLPQIPPPPTSPTYAQATLSCREAMRATPSLIPSPQVCLPPSPLPPMSSLLPPFFLPSPIRPPHTRVAMAQMRVAAPSSHHSLLPSHTPPLLPIPLPAPSTSHRANIPEADMPPRKRLLLTTLYLDTSIRSTERTNMAAIEVVNLRDAHDDRAAVRAEIEILRKEMLAYERQSSETHHALARFESQNRALVGMDCSDRDSGVSPRVAVSGHR
ncbi:hypothetical protein Tco_1266563 [Tanacetum coccineum]